jgi:hypothetical protein
VPARDRADLGDGIQEPVVVSWCTTAIAFDVAGSPRARSLRGRAAPSTRRDDVVREPCAAAIAAIRSP